MNHYYFAGLDVHKKIIFYCLKKADGAILQEGRFAANRMALNAWAKQLPHDCVIAVEATLFTNWIYDVLADGGMDVRVAHPQRLKAIASAKVKNDKLDARIIADVLRAGLLPECYMLPKEIRDMRRALRFRNYLLRLSTSLKNKSAGLLMECGAQYSKKKLHGKRYFQELLGSLDEVPDSVKEMLQYAHVEIKFFETIQRRLLKKISENEEMKSRLELLRTIPGVGEITALSWALEAGVPERFSSIAKAVSYCGLCGAHRESAGKIKRGPLSKQRNPHLQWILIEAAKLAPRYNPRLTEIHARALVAGNRNRATLAVARKMVAYLMAVDKSRRPFEARRF